MEPRWIWHGPSASERSVFVLFRRVVELPVAPASATIHLFADTRYRLFVNGERVEYGPARFPQSAPEYDSVDLAAWLTTGTNVVAVEVNHYGVDSGEADPSPRPGFIAWGEIVCGDTRIGLATPGEWESRRLEAWDRHAPNWSFMNHATEIADLRLLDRSWYVAADVDGFAEPSVVETTDGWGTLRERSVPMLRHRRVDAPLLSGAWELEPPAGGGVAFRVHLPEVRRTALAPIRHSIAWWTWVHAEESMRVELTTLVGDFWLNGHQLDLLYLDEEHDHRSRSAIVTIHAGANLLFCTSRVHSEAWDFAAAFPLDAGLRCLVGRDPASAPGVVHTGAIEVSEFTDRLTSIPADEAGLRALPFEVIERPTDPGVHFPARDCAWDRIRRRLPLPLGATPPLSCLEGAAGLPRAYVFDMDGEYYGHVFVEVEAPAGTIVDISYEEMLRPDGLVPMYRHMLTEFADRYVVPDGRTTIETFHVRGGRYVQITLRPPSSGGGPVTLRRVGYVDATLPVEIRGDFRCSDGVFNETWELCRRTFEVCTTDTYIPEVSRERGLAVADNRLQTHLHRVLSHDMRTSRRSIAMFLDQFHEDGQINSYAPSMRFRPLADFTLLWVTWVHDHWSLTGDASLVEEALPVVRRIFEAPAWHEGTNGLWSTEGIRPFVDWGERADALAGDAHAVLNAFRYQALRAAAVLARAVGEAGEADEWTAGADTVRDAFQRTLWRPDAGVFATSADDPAPSVHANILALAFDLVPPGCETGVLSLVKRALSTNVDDAVRRSSKRSGYLNLYFLFFALEALYRVDEVAFAEEVMRTHWGYLLSRGAHTTWENILQGQPKSFCHVWNAHPPAFFVREILGLAQREAGVTDAFVVAPRTESISWARGTLPLSDGAIDVSWSIRGRSLVVSTRAPERIALEVKPRGRLEALRLVRDHEATPTGAGR
ncbi:MAG: family 78 glycoside hydrolase catalytic domain [Spirochaetota bacterium]